MALTVTNTGTAPIRWLEWGEEQRGYNAGSPASLVLDSDSLVTSGFGGTGATRTGAYDPGAAGNSVIRAAAVPTSPTAVCGTGSQPHVGRFKVSARVYADSTNTRVRLTWRAGDGGYTANPWTTPPVAGAFVRVDLGVIDIPAATVGTQSWDGRVEAYNAVGGPNGAATAIDVDFLQFMPVAEGHGRSKVLTSTAAPSVTAYDGFVGTTAGGTLNARTPQLGAAWATSGATTDFTFLDATPQGAPSSEAVGRSVAAAALRFGVLGSAMTDQQVAAQVGATAATGATGECGVIARWVDASNYLRFTATLSLINAPNAFTPAVTGIQLTKVVAGTPTVLASLAITSAPLQGTSGTLNLSVTATGNVTARLYSATGALLATLSATADVALATGGAIASGKAGIVDGGDGTNIVQRWHTNVQVAAPAPELPVIYPSRAVKITGADTLRESSAGGTWGRETSYRGARFLVPAAGTDALTGRVAVFAHTNDLETQPWEPVTVSHSVTVGYTERGLVVPR